MSENKLTQPNQLQAFKAQRTGEDIKRIHQALVLDAEVKKIPESTFVKEILPIITGEAVSADFPLLMAAVAGTPFSEADIVDDTGEVLFRMPSLLERNIINHTEASLRGSMASMFITVDQLARLSPVRAENYLAHEFNGRGIATNRDEIFKKRRDHWNAILARYGKRLLENGVVVDDKAARSNKQDNSKDRPPLNLDDDGLL